MTDKANIKRENNPAIKNKIISNMLKMVKNKSHFRLDWLNDRSWIAVPLPDSINDEYAQMMSDMSEESGESRCYAVSIDSNNADNVYHFPSTADGFWEFEMEFPLQSYLVLPESLNFAILKDAVDYLIIAGPASLVRIGVGGSISDARTQFRSYANDGFWTDEERRWLNMVANRYESIS